MDKKKYLLIVVFIVVVILVALSVCFKPSESISSYRSEINGNSSARIAKWNVTSVTKKQGESISLDAGFKANILEGTGNWFFDIENGSEVNAAINKNNSTIILRLEAEGLESSGESIDWDFLDGTDNPVNFKIYAYNTSAENLLFYQNKNINSDVIGFTEYAQKTEEEKLNYSEVVRNDDYADYHKTLVLDTQIDSLIFTKKTELIDAKLSTYYELNMPLTDKLASFTANLGFGDSKTNVCFQIEWTINSNYESSTSFGEEEKYNAYTLVEGTPSSALDKYTYTIDGKNYYIHVVEKEFFDYATYTSSLGGEPRFKFKVETSITKISVPFSQLTIAQMNQIEGYQILEDQSLTTLEEVEHLVEYLEYMQYKKFVANNKEFSKKLPYLSMGLKFSMQFNMLVEQVD